MKEEEKISPLLYGILLLLALIGWKVTGYLPLSWLTVVTLPWIPLYANYVYKRTKGES